MKRLVLGTAGHIDHGKTELVRALTGTDTDRWAEEKRRGITIDIGFAKMPLEGGGYVSIVDVPGHERFIRNMLAGASGIDAAIMVVAADDGVMPQTVEHLEILQLLDVREGVIALTKTDLVDGEWISAVSGEIRGRMKGTFLEEAPIFPVSALTGEGIADLAAGIRDLVDRVSGRTEDRPFRMSVDRVFTKSGAGVVVTGTAGDGTVSEGASLSLYPQGKAVRVREIRNHDERIREAGAGMRTALNITGAGKDEIRRGSVLAEDGTVRVTEAVTASLTLFPDAGFAVRNSSRLHFYLGTQELIARVRLLDRDELLPGGRCYAQFFFETPLTARNRDRYIVRFYSPVTTVGGGAVIDADARRLKRRRPEILTRLQALETSDEDLVLDEAVRSGFAMTDEDALLSVSGLGRAEIRSAVEGLLSSGRAVKIGERLIAASCLAEIRSRAEEILGEYHSKHPLSHGMKRGEFLERLFGDGARSARAGEVAKELEDEGVIALRGAAASLASFSVRLSPGQEKIRREIAADYRRFGYRPETDGAYLAGRGHEYEEMFRHMLSAGELVRLKEDCAVSGEVLEEAEATLREMFEKNSRVTLAEFRTATGSSRKYAMMFLEHFDGEGLTRLVGDARILLTGSPGGR